jgi:D-tyrosyl-tRNA(Tyr) deacylase
MRVVKKFIIFGLIALGLTSCAEDVKVGDYVYARKFNGMLSDDTAIFGKVVSKQEWGVQTIVETCNGEFFFIDNDKLSLDISGKTCK